MIIMSHLSDVQESIHYKFYYEEVNAHINFAKWLLLRYPDTSVEIDADEEYEKFINR